MSRDKYLLPAICICIGGSILVWALSEINLAHRAQHWPEVTATVVASHLDSLGVKSGFAPRVVYIYNVNGQEYESDRIFVGSSAGSRVWAQHFVTTYPVGKIVAAHVNPEHSSESILDPGQLSWSNVYAAIAGASFCILCGLSLFLML